MLWFEPVVCHMVLCQGTTRNTDSMLMAGTAAPCLLTVGQTCDFVNFSFDFTASRWFWCWSRRIWQPQVGDFPEQVAWQATGVVCAVNVCNAVWWQFQNW